MRMQHIRKPGKHGKSWFVNFKVIHTITYSTFLSVMCVYRPTLKVLIKIFNVNVVMKLNGTFPCS